MQHDRITRPRSSLNVLNRPANIVLPESMRRENVVVCLPPEEQREAQSYHQGWPTSSAECRQALGNHQLPCWGHRHQVPWVHVVRLDERQPKLNQDRKDQITKTNHPSPPPINHIQHENPDAKKQQER